MSSKEPESSVMPATEWDGKPMAYTVVQATDEDGNPVEDSTGKPAGGKRSGSSAADKENRA